MRAVSETLSFIIISSAVIAISLVVFFIAMSLSNETRYIMEYGQIRTILKDIAVARFPDLLRGSQVRYHFTSSSIGIGYKKLDTVYEMVITKEGINNSYVVNNFYSIYASANKVLASGETILFGSKDRYIVNDTENIPLLMEYNTNTGTITELIINKICYTVLNITTSKGSNITVRLIIPRIIKPLVYGKNTMIVYANINDAKTTNFTNVKSFSIYINNENKVIDSQQIFSEIGLDPNEITSFQLYIVVYDIHFEIY
ncbi:MAG: hypothetical protein J7L82_07420 [Staphylothermus sp.]|nr:hypothetical protein [Staphylothermus sp.]